MPARWAPYILKHALSSDGRLRSGQITFPTPSQNGLQSFQGSVGRAVDDFESDRGEWIGVGIEYWVFIDPVPAFC